MKGRRGRKGVIFKEGSRMKGRRGRRRREWKEGRK